MKKIVIIFCMVLFIPNIYGQDKVLNQYIQEGFDNNEALKQHRSSYEKSIQALKEAKGMFFPEISLNARYSVAEGGRTIDLPVGDMLNPVYRNLNQLNQALSATNPAFSQFPQYTSIDNETIHFLRPTEHETKLRMVQPVFNTDIYFNNQIKEEMTEVKKADLETYQRYLISEIKKAYYDYLKSIEMMDMLENTRKVVKENIRVSEKLHKAEKITIDQVYRSRAELGKLKQKISKAEANKNSAHSYFNFLLNRPLDTSIKVEKEAKIQLTGLSLRDAQSQAVKKREALQKLNSYENIAKKQVSMHQYNRLPTVSAMVDYGFQGKEYDFSGSQDFVLASFVLKWNLFKGLQNNAQIQQAKIDQDIARSRYKESQQKIKLEIIRNFYALESAYKAIDAAREQMEAARRSFQLIEKKYKLGQAPLIEYLDARNNYTNARQNLIIKKYDYQVKYVKFEKVACLVDLKQYE